MQLNPQYRVEAAGSGTEKPQFPGLCSAISGRRYYNPQLGRWLGRDPVEEKGGLHLYNFCENNPVNRWDILGQYYEITTDGNNVTINIPIYFQDQDVNKISPTTLNGIITNITNNWSGKFGDLTVTTKVTQISDPSSDNYAKSNTLVLSNLDGRSEVRNFDGHALILLYANDLKNPRENTPAHEIGHVLGLPDQYQDLVQDLSKPGSDLIKSRPGEYRNKQGFKVVSFQANTGYENSIMGNAFNKVSLLDIQNVLKLKGSKSPVPGSDSVAMVNPLDGISQVTPEYNRPIDDRFVYWGWWLRYKDWYNTDGGWDTGDSSTTVAM